jgi:glutathione-regulated potassium-efflux system protein KefB
VTDESKAGRRDDAMNIQQLLLAVAVMLLATAVALGVAKKLNLGSIVALLVVGMALGPHSPRPLFTGHIAELQAIGEIGVMLLLFVVGLSIKPGRLWSMRRLVVGLGASQYLLTAAAIAALLIGMSAVQWQAALVVGLALAMSSTAMPLQFLRERGGSPGPEGEAVIAVDIFQSLAVIPVLALLPVLAARHTHPDLVSTLDKAIAVCAVLAAVYVTGRFVLPRALMLTARNLGSGAFALVVLAGVFGAAWLVEQVGISMALGTFMIGVLLSTSPFAEQVKGAATPAKQVLLALFFISIGMAIDIKELAALGPSLLLYLPLLLLVKLGIVLLLAIIFRLGVHAAFLSGLLLMPFDEIGYVIFASANTHGLLSDRAHALGLAAISLSFIVSPLLINLGYRLAQRLEHRRLEEAPDRPADGQVVVAGYSPAALALCVMLERAQVPYVCYETDVSRLREAVGTMHNVHYGDIADPSMMEAVALARARLVVAAAGEYVRVKRLIGNLRQFYREVPVMAAVRYLAEQEELRQLGTENVAALAPESALTFGQSVLVALGVTADQATAIVGALKADDYAELRRAGAVDLAQA